MYRKESQTVPTKKTTCVCKRENTTAACFTFFFFFEGSFQLNNVVCTTIVYCYTSCPWHSIVEREGLVYDERSEEEQIRRRLVKSVTCYFFYFGFINLIFLNIKLLSSDFYFNGIGLVLTKQCHFIEMMLQMLL
jgi:hypothetical protein